MPGLLFYYVPPRLVGSIEKWPGLIEHAKDLGFNALLFSPFQTTTEISTERPEGLRRGSLYAIRNHFAVDPEFSTGDRLQDAIKIRQFSAAAQAAGLKIFADLVFNHMAADHPLVDEENKAIRAVIERSYLTGKPLHPIYTGENGDRKLIGLSYDDKGPRQLLFKFARHETENFRLIGWKDPENHDRETQETAQINYDSPAARAFFIDGVDGKKGYWKQVIEWYGDAGFNNFRCDVAYRLPPGWWEELIAHAHEKYPGTQFMGETLGGSAEQVERMGEARITLKGKNRPAFDLGMLSNHWWNFLKSWLPFEEIPRLGRAAHFGGVGAPDNQDTAATVPGYCRAEFQNRARHPDLSEQRRMEITSDICARNYAVSVFIGNSASMQMGYEFCREKQNVVFAGFVSPGEWEELRAERAREDHPLNICKRIRAINKCKTELGVENCYAIVKDCSRDVQNPNLVKIQCSYIDVDTGQETAEVVVLLNKKPQFGAIRVSEEQMRDSAHRHLDRLVLGSGDITERDLIHEVMILHTPVKSRAPAAIRAARPGSAL